ncbi:ABC transporter ATP-binding protein [Azohydromonas aeria]|uniref:ABC transporter ATP-binding protein n=1 Tax=Azohydromonas aeria TaxID=2590212 RepID=UPI0012FAD0DF|nr:ATP-binding cassette domain-containing protein [Azohydromonas aeria]
MSAAANAPVLSLRGVRYRWPGAPHDVIALDELLVAPGERLLLRGGSGCGKSTLLSLAAGVLLAQSGEVALLGQDWRALRAGRRDRRRSDHIGYVFQQFNLVPYLSVLDNVLLPCRFSALRAQRAGARPAEEATRLLQALQLDDGLLGRPAQQLSVGQQQRVAAARALLGRPEVVIADEPTSALDEDRRDAFMRLLLRECEAAGSALLFVSHDARLASHFPRVIDLPVLNRAAQLAEA